LKNKSLCACEFCKSLSADENFTELTEMHRDTMILTLAQKVDQIPLQKRRAFYTFPRHFFSENSNHGRHLQMMSPIFG
jgi:hypothetical protein